MLYLVLGYIDSTPQGPVEVWYSGSGEVLRLQGGHIVGTAGLQTDWRAVRFSQEPQWHIGSAETAPLHFTRERDLMPGYHSRVQDHIERAVIPPPNDSQLTQWSPKELHWLEERSQTRPATASLAPSRFALATIDGKAEVVYSEQCITAEFCLTLERWVTSAPAAGDAVRSGT